jgi:hypothetical protein
MISSIQAMRSVEGMGINECEKRENKGERDRNYN